MPQITFATNNREFHKDISEAIKQYFKANGKSQRGNTSLFLKAFFMYAVVISIYLTLVFSNAWFGIQLPNLVSILMLCTMGTFMAFIGFNVMHDSCHGAFSNNSTINEIFGYSLNFLGADCYYWKVKHNVLHHTYTNIDGVDDDIFKPPFLRMSPNQPYNSMHKNQHKYMLFLYGISTLFWIFYMDFNKYFTNKVHTTELPKMSLKNHLIFWFTKIYFIAVWVITPIVFLGVSKFLIGFFLYNFVMGIVMSVVFQLAHIVQGVDFADAQNLGNIAKIEEDWAIFQMKTTFDFSPNSKFLTWALGGLNFQVEHHLFPKVSHVHYPAIRPIVKEICKNHNVPHNEFKSFWLAVKSHFAMMAQLGENPKLVSA
ncbi:MAG: acyl-CoA desaturase [Bacteroidetes bacterium]|nr:acyl-CoA desaturase [Bacteroidota bacterium]